MSKRPTNAIPADQVEPREFKVAPWGKFAGLDDIPRIVNERTVQSLPVFQRATGREEVALDFEHETVPKVDEDGNIIPDDPGAEPIIIAGYGRVEARPGDGIYLVMTWWTPDGLKAYKSGSYRDLSPTLRDDPETHEVLGIHSVALTRAGQLSGIKAYSADFDGITKNKPKPNMDEEKMKKLVAAIVAAIKQKNPEADLSEESDLDDIIGGLSGLLSPMNADEEEKKAPETVAANAGGDEKKDAACTIEALSAEVKRLSSALEDMEKKAMSSENDALINEAVSEGKELPMSAGDLKKLPSPILKKLLNGLTPGIVPMSAGRYPAGSKQPESAQLRDMRNRWGIKQDKA